MAFNLTSGLGSLTDSANSEINKANNLLSAVAAGSAALSDGLGTPAQGPWGEEGSLNSFFPPIPLQGDRWDRLYPYRLIVVKAEKGGQYTQVPGRGDANVGKGVSARVTANGIGSIILEFTPNANQWEFRLPITPQQYSVSTMYAINTTATLKGITEEHNGVRFKMITCAGSLGVWNQRKQKNSPPENPTILSTLFSGTIEAFSSLSNQISRTLNSFQNHPATKPKTQKPEGTLKESTGYYQMLLLDQFLEQYAEAKKDPENANWRLAFDIPKENQTLLVTPVDFAYSKSAESPNEPKFRLQFKAWKRIKISSPVEEVKFSDLTLTPDLLSKLITAVEEARRTLGASYNLIKAVRSDFQTPFNLLREISLFAKDAAGVPAAVIDLPRQIISDAKSSIKDVLNNLDDAAVQLTSGTSQSLKSSLSSVKSSFSSREGISDAAVSSGQIGLQSSVSLLTDPTIELFNNPEQNFDLFNLITSSSVNFNFSQNEKIDSDLAVIRETTVDDLIKKRNQLLELALQISNSFGAGDADYSRIYSRATPYSRIQQMTIDEHKILVDIYSAIQSIDSVTSTNELDEGRTQSAFEYVGSLASQSDITFEQNSKTKIRVPVPFGLNMEQIASRYLGDPDRWLEIATLNNLRSPYIDEDGFFYTLLSNAEGRQFNVSSSDNLYIGQKIIISSLTQPLNTRHIVNIEKISPTNFLITVDGLDNLDVFLTSDSAKMRAFLPGTINSQDQIFVPSTLAATDTVLSRPVPATKGDPLTGLSKVDWLITESGDLAIDAYGDVKLAFGLSNLIQALKLKFATPPNKLIKHQGYGAGLTPGVSNADVENGEVIQNIIDSIKSDPRFGDIINLTITRRGPTLGVSVVVDVADGNGVFPISFVLNS